MSEEEEIDKKSFNIEHVNNFIKGVYNVRILCDCSLQEFAEGIYRIFLNIMIDNKLDLEEVFESIKKFAKEDINES